MSDDRTAHLSQLIDSVSRGESNAAAEVTPSVIQELRAIAGGLFRGESSGHTMQPTALVNEAWLRVYGNVPVAFKDRKHLINTFRLVMKHLLIDRAKKYAAEKHGGGKRPASLDPANLEFIDVPMLREFGIEQVEAVKAAIERLRAEKPEYADIVEYKYYVDLTEPQIAEIMGIGVATVGRYWRFSRAWLHAEVGGGGGSIDGGPVA